MRPGQTVASPSSWLYVWTASADSARHAAFMTVFDLRQNSPTAGKVVRTVWAGAGTRGTHHTEYYVQPDGLLFANDFGTGRTFIFDLRNPGEPLIHGTFTTAGPFGWPHSYVRLPNGNRLVTYQWQSTKFDRPPGGIAEVRTDGTVVRWASAATPAAADSEITPYSLEVLPALDRAVSTSTSMMEGTGVHVQIWRLSDLKLLYTLRIPAADPHAMHDSDTTQHHLLPGEPRVLADGHTVMLGTFTCGLYMLTQIETAEPRLSFVHSFPGENCAVPVVIGKYWLQTVPALHGVVALDVSNPATPREVSRVVLGEKVRPHWLASDPSGRRLVTNSSNRSDPDLYLLSFDPVTGRLGKDLQLPVLSIGRVNIPELGEVIGIPHGAVFSR